MSFNKILKDLKDSEELVVGEFQKRFNPLLGKSPEAADVLQMIDRRRNIVTVAVMQMLTQMAAYEFHANGDKLPDDCVAPPAAETSKVIVGG